MVGFILKVLFLAVVLAFLYAWGIIKQQRRDQELLNELQKKAEEKIIKAFGTNDKLSIVQIEKIIADTKASLFWSKHKLKITEPKLFSKHIMTKMENRGLIEVLTQNGPKKYILKRG